MVTKQGVASTENENNDTLPVLSSRDRVRSAIQEMRRDASDVSEKIMANILDAESVDDVFAQTSGDAATLVPAENMYGIPLRVLSVSLNQSSFAEGPDAYCVVEAVNLLDNENVTLGCGASNIVAGLIKLHQMRAFPLDLVMYESNKRTAAGYQVTLMRRATEADLNKERF